MRRIGLLDVDSRDVRVFCGFTGDQGGDMMDLTKDVRDGRSQGEP